MIDGQASISWPHKSVLYHEVLQYLQPHPGGRYVDATLGAGGHASAILEQSAPDGMLIGIDQDQQALEIAHQRLKGFNQRIAFCHSSFAQLSQILDNAGWKEMDGIIFDLGISSMQLETPDRGFSFLKEGPLDMRFNPQQGISAAELINYIKEEELTKILREYGEEPQARKIAAAICQARPLQNTKHLAQVVLSVHRGKHGHLHPATRTFQALRMAVNQELPTLQSGLEQSLEYLAKKGRIVVIAFHSLEDRLVKQFMQRESRDCLCPPQQPICTCGHHARLLILTKHAIKPSAEELSDNPRARSAHLRAAEKII